MKYSLDDLERLEKAATPGPWKWHRHYYTDIGDDPPDEWTHESLAGPEFDPEGYPYKNRVMDDGSANGEYSVKIHSESPDGKFIAAARNALPELIARMRKLEAAVAAARKLIAVSDIRCGDRGKNIFEAWLTAKDALDKEPAP